MMKQTCAIFIATIAAVHALNSVQLINTNTNLQSTSNENPTPYWQIRNNNLYYWTGGVRSYQPSYPNDYSGYRYRRQVIPIVKEANAQYQHQGANQYDERVNAAFPYSNQDAYRYRENNQYQLQGNAQSRLEADARYGYPFDNRYQSQQQGAFYRQRYQY